MRMFYYSEQVLRPGYALADKHLGQDYKVRFDFLEINMFTVLLGLGWLLFAFNFMIFGRLMIIITLEYEKRKAKVDAQ